MFSRLGLHEPLLATLADLGYTKPTPVQTQAIPAVLEGRDLLAAAQTGTGKTAGFALPILQMLNLDVPAEIPVIRALVMVPTRELAEQVLNSIRRYAGAMPLRCYAVYGGVSISPQLTALSEGIDFLVATPGRLLDLHRQGAIKLNKLRTLVLDEADRMLDLGFARELEELFAILPSRRQTLLFSATFSDEIRQLAKMRLRKPLTVETSPRNSTAKQVKQWVVPVDKKRKPALFQFMLKDRAWGQVLVFVRTRKGVEQLVEQLLAKGIRADSIHGDKPQASRLKALESFKAGAVQILVATDVAARGLDIDDLPQVVNFDLPMVAEDYVHRIGRTGRAGASGEAVSLVCADEVEQLAAIERLIGKPLERLEEPGFEPDHRVPMTQSGGVAFKSADKAKPSPARGKGKVPGNWVGFGNESNAGGRRGQGRRAGPGKRPR